MIGLGRMVVMTAGCRERSLEWPHMRSPQAMRSATTLTSWMRPIVMATMFRKDSAADTADDGDGDIVERDGVSNATALIIIMSRLILIFRVRATSRRHHPSREGHLPRVRLVMNLIIHPPVLHRPSLLPFFLLHLWLLARIPS